MPKKFVICFFFILNLQIFTQEITTNEIVILEETNTVKMLTYAAYVETIRELIPEIKINAATVTNAENVLLSAESVGDINLNAQVGAIGKKGAFNTLSPTTPIDAHGFRTSVGAGSLIPYSGTRWDASFSHDSLFNAGSTGSSYTPSLTLQVTQPLLRNFFGALDKYPIKDAEYSLSIAELQRDIQDISVLTSYKKMYYEWIMYEKLVAYLEKMIESSKDFENQIKRRLRNNLVDNDDYQNAITQTLRYEDTYSDYAMRLTNIKNAINYFMPITDTNPDDTAWDVFLEIGKSLKDIEALEFKESIYGQVAHQENLRAEYFLDAMKNNSLPDLAFVGSVTLGGVDTDDYFNSYGQMTNVDYFMGLSFSYPIGGRQYKAQLRNAENGLYTIMTSYEQADRDYTLQLSTIINRYKTYKVMLDSKSAQIAAIESRMKTQLVKFKQGRLEIDDYIKAGIELVQTQTEYLNLEYLVISNIFDYRELLAIE